MASEQLVTKYINMALAEAFERMVRYKKQAEKKTKSAREKAVWKVAYQEASSMFNYLSRTIGPYGTSKIALSGLDSIDWNEQASKRNKFIDALDEEDIVEVLAQSYKLSEIERDSHKEAQKTVIVHYMLENPEFVERMKTGIESIKKSMQNKQRGNPKLGGLVTQAMHRGMLPTVARKIAEQQMIEVEAVEVGQAIMHDPERAKAIRAVNQYNPDQDALLAMLEPSKDVPDVMPEPALDSDEAFDDPENL